MSTYEYQARAEIKKHKITYQEITDKAAIGWKYISLIHEIPDYVLSVAILPSACVMRLCSLTLTHSLSRRQPNVQAEAELNKHGGGKTLGEDASVLGRGWHLKNLNVTKSHTLAEKMQVDLNMFGPLMLNRVCREVDNIDAAIDDGDPSKWTMKLGEKLS